MTRLPIRAGSLAARLLARLELSGAVPVRTSVLVRESGASPSRVWAALERLRARGLVEKLRAERLPGESGLRAAWRHTPPAPVPAADETVETAVRGHALAVLARHGGDKTRAAAALGVSRPTLRRWLRRWVKSRSAAGFTGGGDAQ